METSAEGSSRASRLLGQLQDLDPNSNDISNIANAGDNVQRSAFRISFGRAAKTVTHQIQQKRKLK
jgi:hypothetical protein